MNPWAEPGLPRFLIDAALAGLAIALAGWLISLALFKARTEWRISAILAVLVSLIAVPLTAAAGQNMGTGRVAGLETLLAESPAQIYSQAAQQEVAQQSSGKAAQRALPSVEPEAPLLTPGIVGLVWAGFAGTLLILAIIRLLGLRYWLRRNAVLESSDRIALYRANVAAPFCGGIFKPFIVIPSDFEELPEAERRAVTIHETAHLELGHPTQKLVGEITMALFGWIPFVALLTRQLSDLQERQCDEAVIRKEGDGLALAKGLVRFAERCGSRMAPASTLSIVRRRSRLESRVRRLVNPGGLSMPPKKPIVTLTALSLGLAVTAIGLAAQVGKDPLAEAKSFMPFRPGTTLLYRTIDADGRTSRIEMQAITLKENKPYPVMEFHRRQDNYGRYDYWMATPKGLVPLDNRSLMDEPGFSGSRERGPQLPSPAAVGYEWTWSEEFRGQTMMGPGGTPPPPPPPIKYTGKVVAVDRQVKVPYGTVKATVVEIVSGGRYGYLTRTYWAKNVGVVKREYLDKDGKVTRTEELLSLQSGKG